MQFRLQPPDDFEPGFRKRQLSWRVALRSKHVRGLSFILFIFTGCHLLWVYLRPFAHPRVPVVTETYPGVDWSRFAYAQYTTEETYLCNSLMIFETLQRLQTKPDRILMYPNSWSTTSGSIAGMLLKARDEFNVKLRPISVLQASTDKTWGASFTKLLVFNQTDYQRVLSIDSDSTILQSMDELFLVPSAPVAMPRAYWLQPEKDALTSALVLLEPSDFEFSRITQAIKNKSAHEFDMDVVNSLYRNHCLTLPHRPYFLISGEFRGNDHSGYLGSGEEEWDPAKVFGEAKLLHFSDWPYPKPWLDATIDETNNKMPNCSIGLTGEADCRSRNIWLSLYEDFRERRKVASISPSYFSRT
ncbi:hypothetical protein AJ78_07389 [Emergomyces pasteurianus Ep9510]|uniref:Glucose N-acetyltransferase 1 n=1 Tax=Emergomyces pasteurianus Ep9510 TaxID=1447872 RepID=A0A1J9Q7N2_9EURO|nr:hypothetical protein AJ78_07389 [Emergomyces pasteurianus Ep9510]